MNTLKKIFLIFFVLSFITACGGGGGGGSNGGTTGGTAGGSADAGSTDGGTTDGGSTDGGSTDGGSTDGGSTDGGSTDGGSTDGGSSSENTTVQDMLDDLNVPTVETDRLDANGDPLPDTYAPFGSKVTANKFSEILLFGVPINDSDLSTSESEMAISNLVPGSNNSFSWELLHEEPVANAPWTDEDAKRSTAAADFDDDGIEEIVVVYQLDGDVELVMMDDANEDFAISAIQDVDNNTVDQIFIGAGDYDGDADVDILVGLVSTTGSAELKLMVNDNGSFAYEGLTIDIPRLTSNIYELVIKSGNFDYDAAIEFVVAINAQDFDSRYNIYDDANTDFAPLLVDQRIELATVSGSTRAIVHNLDVGDVDGDNLDEIILGGLNRTGTVGNIGYNSFQYMIEIIDDRTENFAPLVSGFEDILLSDDGNYQPSSSGANQRLNHVPVVAADIDGDGAKEFLIGQHLFQSLSASPNSLAYFDDENDGTDDDGRARIPAANWFGEATSGMMFEIDWDTYSVAAGDVTLDGRENIVIYSQNRATIIGQEQQLQVWGNDQINGWVKIADYANSRQTNSGYNPQLHLPDIELDDGTAMLSYSSGSHELVFTEPLILAAIAAAPCATDLGQDLSESCRSAYGSAVSDSTIKTDGSTVSAKASIGYGVGDPVTPNSIEVTASLERRARSWTSNGYTLTKTLLYETGSIEDSVVFSSIPMDVYTYDVLSHPDPELVGGTVVVRLPREPVTIMVTRDKFNESVLDDSLKIDDSVFSHTEGEPLSYPTPAEKNALLSRYDGIEGTATSVGEGLGQTISTISSFETTTEGSDYETTKSIDVRATGGLFGGYVIGGVSVGFGANSSVEVTHGTESIYQGAVGNITSENFDAGLSYNWGLFTYLYDQNGQQPFEVINYWVED